MRTIEISCDQSCQLNATPSKGDNSIPDPVTTHALTPCSPAGKRKIHIQLQIHPNQKKKKMKEITLKLYEYINFLWFC